MVSDTERDIICYGEIEIFKITPDINDEVVEFYKNNFLKNENVGIACDLAKSDLAIAEVEAVVRVVLADGIGFVARDCKTKEMVAFCINKMLNPSTDAVLGFQFQSSGVLCGGEFVHRMKSSFDVFKEWNIDCAMEIVFLSTRADFGGRGLALALSERSIEFAKQMLQGTLKDRDTLPEHIRHLKPKAVVSIFTSFFTQRVGEKLGMETMVRIPFTEFSFEGKTFAEKINPIHTSATYAGIKL